MKVNHVTAACSGQATDGAAWTLKFAGGAFDGVPLSPAPGWEGSTPDLDEDEVREMIEATASWEGIPLATDYTVEIVR